MKPIDLWNRTLQRLKGWRRTRRLQSQWRQLNRGRKLQMLPLLWALDKSLSTLKASQTDGLRNPASPQGARSIVNGNGIKTPPASAANAQTSAPPKSPRRSRGNDRHHEKAK